MNELARDKGYYLDCVLVKNPLELRLYIGDGFILDKDSPKEYVLREEKGIIKFSSVDSQKREKVNKCRDLSTFIKNKVITDMYSYFKELQVSFVEIICQEYEIDKIYVNMKEVEQ